MAHREPVGPGHRTQAGPAPLLAAGAALLLLVSLFLDWFENADDGNGDGATAWTIFEIVDLLLAGIALVALWRAAHMLGALRNGPNVRFWQLGAAALLLVVSQLINKPPLAQFSEIKEDVGVWLALAASLLLLIAGLMNRIRVELVDHSNGDRHAHEPAGATAPPVASTPPAPAAPAPAPGETAPTRPIAP